MSAYYASVLEPVIPCKGVCLLSMAFNQCNSTNNLSEGHHCVCLEQSDPAAVWSSLQDKSNAKSSLHYNMTFLFLSTKNGYLGLNTGGEIVFCMFCVK